VETDEPSIAIVDTDGVLTGMGTGSRLLGCICTRVSAQAEGRYADVLVLIGSPPASLEMVTADGQVGVVGNDGFPVETPGSPTITVKIRDSSGAPVRGMFPKIEVTGGGTAGEYSRHGSTADGSVSVRWRMGEVAGPNTATVHFRQLSSRTLHATGVPGQPRTMTRASAEVLTGTPGGTVTAPAVRVADRYGNPIPSHRVVFTVTGGGGSVTGAETVTDANGIATAGTWTLGAAPGINLLRAATSSGTSFVFSITTLP